MINYSGLSSSKLDVTYETSKLEIEGYKLKFMLNPDNPVFQQVVDQCKKLNLLYKIIDGEGSQKHIWIKDWKNV